MNEYLDESNICCSPTIKVVASFTKKEAIKSTTTISAIVTTIVWSSVSAV